MNACATPRRSTEAGFLLVEAVIAVALVAICAGAALAAVAAVMHGTARTASSASLASTAQNVLTDLRAATAYDSSELAGLAGKSAAFDVSEPQAAGPARRVHIVARIAYVAASDTYMSFVSATAADGTTVTLNATLVTEAPAPGSTVSASTPPPKTAASDDLGQLQL